MGQWAWLAECLAGQLMVARNKLLYWPKEQHLQQDWRIHNNDKGLHTQPPQADRGRGVVEGHSNQDQRQVGLADGGWRMV